MTKLRHLSAAALVVMAAVSACQPSSQPEVEVRGLVVAGPTCPVVTDPPDPSCADRPVEGAVLVVTTDAGSEVARATSDADGAFGLTLPLGTYRLTPQPVAGLMGTPGSIDFAVGSAATTLELPLISYDTGIR